MCVLENALTWIFWMNYHVIVGGVWWDDVKGRSSSAVSSASPRQLLQVLGPCNSCWLGPSALWGGYWPLSDILILNYTLRPFKIRTQTRRWSFDVTCQISVEVIILYWLVPSEGIQHTGAEFFSCSRLSKGRVGGDEYNCLLHLLYVSPLHNSPYNMARCTLHSPISTSWN